MVKELTVDMAGAMNLIMNLIAKKCLPKTEIVKNTNG